MELIQEELRLMETLLLLRQVNLGDWKQLEVEQIVQAQVVQDLVMLEKVAEELLEGLQHKPLLCLHRLHLLDLEIVVDLD